MMSNDCSTIKESVARGVGDGGNNLLVATMTVKVTIRN